MYTTSEKRSILQGVGSLWYKCLILYHFVLTFTYIYIYKKKTYKS